MSNRWLWPLTGLSNKNIPRDGDGSFGWKRRFDMHTGVDLYCEAGQRVVAAEDGQVIWVDLFTGEKAQSPWWNDTRAVMIEGASGVLLYGELQEEPGIVVGASVKRGQLIGTVLTVRKHDRGKPMTMLHFERYDCGIREPVWWYHDQPQPRGLTDPTVGLRFSEEKDNG